MSRSKKRSLIFSIIISSLLFSGCSNLLMPSRRSHSSSQEDSISSRVDFTSSNYSTSSNARTSSSNYSTSSDERTSSNINASSSDNSSASSYSSDYSSYSSEIVNKEGFFIEDGKLINYNGSDTVVNVPSEWDGQPVTEVCDFAFTECLSIVSVVFPNTIEKIGSYVFRYCSSLITFNIPASVVYIGDDLIGGCASLLSIKVDENNLYYSSINGVLFNKDKTKLLAYPTGKTGDYTVPDSVTTIGTDAFCTCFNLSSLILPNKLTSIESSAFYMCTRLKTLSLPNSLLRIEDKAFFECSSLETIYIPANVNYIGSGLFVHCFNLSSITVDPNNENYLSEDGILFNKSKTNLITCPVLKNGTYSIPYGVKVIMQYAFYYCRNLTSIVFSSTVTKITDETSFMYCGGLLSFDVDSNNNNFSSEDGVLLDKDKTTIILFPASKAGLFVAPNSIVTIGASAFNECDSLTSIILPESLLDISFNAFYNCTSLSWAVLPKSISIIRSNAFSGCQNLEKVFYTGTVDQWESIQFGGSNESLINASRYYYLESQPSDSGNYWHYVNGVPTIW